MEQATPKGRSDSLLVNFDQNQPPHAILDEFAAATRGEHGTYGDELIETQVHARRNFPDSTTVALSFGTPNRLACAARAVLMRRSP